MNRKDFLRTVAGAALATLAPGAELRAAALFRRRADFTFTRLQYASGNWDVDQRMPANLLNSLIAGIGSALGMVATLYVMRVAASRGL